MKRKAIESLIKWKETENRTPILIHGAKGVGKTYLAYDFAKAFFERIIYVNFEQEPSLKKIFSAGDADKIIELLEQHCDSEEKGKSEAEILILDEISYCEEVIEFLHLPQFAERFRYILCISSSRIPTEYGEQFHVLKLFPLEFDEFLIATGNEWYIDLIYTHYHNNKKLPDIVHKELLDLFDLYLRIGGMPGSMNEHLSLSSTVNVSELHRIIIGFIRDCILMEFEERDSLKMLQVFNSISRQLNKENKKFQYRLIRKGTTYSMYKESIQNLIDKKYIIKCNRLNNEQLSAPFDYNAYLESCCDDTNTAFKLYMLDTGLLFSQIAGEHDSSYKPFVDKTLLENYVAQSLQAKQYSFAFWESDSIARIDFIVCKDNELIPLEIYTESNTRSKSLSILKQKYNYPYAYKVSAKNFEFTNNIKYVPYYAMFCI